MSALSEKARNRRTIAFRAAAIIEEIIENNPEFRALQYEWETLGETYPLFYAAAAWIYWAKKEVRFEFCSTPTDFELSVVRTDRLSIDFESENGQRLQEGWANLLAAGWYARRVQEDDRKDFQWSQVSDWRELEAQVISDRQKDPIGFRDEVVERLRVTANLVYPVKRGGDRRSEWPQDRLLKFLNKYEIAKERGLPWEEALQFAGTQVGADVNTNLRKILTKARRL